jgi:uncharacterized protein (DUF305 family)
VVITALLALSTGVLAACGETDKPDRSGGGAVPGNSTDQAFVREMVPHHRLAIEMAHVAQDRAQTAATKQLSRDIIRTQSEEIATMVRIRTALDQQGVKPGDIGVPEEMRGMHADLAGLRSASPFDREFVDMMIPHHEGAIRMARVELARGENPTLKRLSRAIIDAQAREIGEMKAFRQQRFGGAPAGGAPPHSPSGAGDDAAPPAGHGE